MVLITTANILAFTDRVAGMYQAMNGPLAAVGVKLQAGVDFIFGGASNGNTSIGDPNAQQTIGNEFLVSQANASGPGLYLFVLGNLIAGMSSYLQQRAPAALGTGIMDIPSVLRLANGCPVATTAGGGAGTNFVNLAHPDYAALVALINPASPLPPDVVFAPTGVVLGTFNAATGAFGAGAALMTASTASAPNAPYAPAKLFTAATPAAGPALPNGSCYVTVTGLNQVGVSKTWRGNIGSGLTAANQTLAAGILVGTSGGSTGGTASSTDRLKQITNIARDTSVSSGGTATAGVINIVTLQERAAL